MLRAAQSAPTTLAAAILPAAARSNPAAFYTSSGTPLTAAQFLQHVRDRVTRAMSDAGLAVPAGAVSLGASGAASANAAGAGAGTWSTRAPRITATASERQMAASLVAVFAKLDQTQSAARHGKNQHGLPRGIVSALTGQPGGVGATSLTGVSTQ